MSVSVRGCPQLSVDVLMGGGGGGGGRSEGGYPRFIRGCIARAPSTMSLYITPIEDLP